MTINVEDHAIVSPALSIQLWNFAPKDPGVGGWKPILDQARAADASGIDRLVVSDHVILGENLEVYGDPRAGGVEGGRQPTGPDGHWLDPLTLVAVGGLWLALFFRLLSRRPLMPLGEPSLKEIVPDA